MKIPLFAGALFLVVALSAGCTSTGRNVSRGIIPDPLSGGGPALTTREKLHVKHVGDGKETLPPVASHDYVRPTPKLPLTNLMMRVADIGGEEPLTPREFRSPAGARFVRLEF